MLTHRGKQFSLLDRIDAQIRFEIREGQSSKPHLNKYNQPYGRYK